MRKKINFRIKCKNGEMRKLNYLNIFRAFVGILGIIVVFSDLGVVLIGGNRWTWFGFITFLMSAYFMIDFVWMIFVEGKLCQK